MREKGTVNKYNGFDGEIANEGGIYSFLNNEVHREDREYIEVGAEVSFEPVEQKTNTSTFKMAKNVAVITKRNIQKPATKGLIKRRIKNYGKRPM